ncbi:hypothetical protein GCM10029992_62880 [Glycomyces albus]
MGRRPDGRPVAAAGEPGLDQPAGPHRRLGRAGRPWPPPEQSLAEPPAAAPEAAADQSYRPDSFLPPEQYRSPEQTPAPEAYQERGQAPDPYLAPDPQVTAGTDPYHADSPYAPPETVPHPRRPEQTAPQPPLSGEAPAGPPTEQPPSAPPPAADEGPKKVTPPPTHKGVRYAIYGIGGFITLGLIIAIVVMLGGPRLRPHRPGRRTRRRVPGPGRSR